MELKTTIERDNVYSHSAKKNIDKKHDKILGELFFSLAKAKGDGIATDHSPSNSVCRTLDIYQVQQLIQVHCGRLYTHMEMIDALYDLVEPELIKPSTIHFNSEIDGKRISAIRLIYSNPREGSVLPVEDADTDNLAQELLQVDLSESAETWKTKAFEVYEQHTIDRETIQSLRSVIIDMAETLHVADPNARISMSSGDLLDLIHSQKDMPNNPF